MSVENVKVEHMPGDPTLPLGMFNPEDSGYSVKEFTVSGKAASYRMTGAASKDGRWNITPAQSAPYATRIVAVLPQPERFNGTVVVEWVNVTGGLDVPVSWVMAHRQMMREGYGYVAVSAQRVGVEGGPSLSGGAAMPLKSANPERYKHLNHPGDEFSFGIFSQVGKLLAGDRSAEVLGSRTPQRVIAIGESQSAFFLTTYINSIDPQDSAYHGFFVHSRSGVAAPIDGALLGAQTSIMQTPIKLRPDLRVPVIQVITETDLISLAGDIGFYAARQPDTHRLRTWEVAGTAHADNYLFSVGMIDFEGVPIDKLAAAWAPTKQLQGMTLELPMNNGPQHHYVVQAAIAKLDHWLRTGEAPPAAPRLAITEDAPPKFVLDANGIALGGIRTPWVDVPLSRLSGLGAPEALPLIGVSESFSSEKVVRLYPGGKSDYLRKFEASLDKTIAQGFILAADRREILLLAERAYDAAIQNGSMYEAQ